ncbi:MAG TPA: trypsin-like peptidase domain-containing protein [Gaiellaceae bacterium]|jgi:S1-C subfamily serine protease
MSPRRSSLLAVVAVVAALLGGTAALAIGKATGWIDGDGGAQTVFVPVHAEGSTGTPGIGTSNPIQSNAKPLAGNGFEPSKIYQARASGVVTIYALFGSHAENGDGPTSQGSGFVVSDDGYILTNSHVITTAGEDPVAQKADAVYVEFRSGERVAAQVVGFDLYDDVGLLKVNPEDHPLDPVPLGDSSNIVVGDPVAAIGSPFGQTTSLSVGVVSATERSIDSLTSQFRLVDAIQIDAPINRGNSGGPLFDARGRVIGINAQIQTESGNAEGVGFAVPIDSAKRSMEQLVATGAVKYAWVGVRTQTVTPGLAKALQLPADRGAAIQDVRAGSPAADAGLRGGTRDRSYEGIDISTGGDIIVAIDGKPVQTAEDVVRQISRLDPGDRVVFTLVRGDDRVDVPLILGERPPPDSEQTP